MLDMMLLVRLLLSFLVGSSWVVFTTVMAEKKGTTFGGVLGGFPSTAAFSFLFIGLNQSSEIAAEATVVFPLIFAVTNTFLLFFSIFSRKGFLIGIVASLIIWLVSSMLIFLSGFKDFYFSLLFGLIISFLTYFLFTRKLNLQPFTGKVTLYGFKEILLRGLGAGVVVAGSVFLSQIGGPVLGGIAAAFPAVFTSTLIILNRRRGLEFTRSASKPLAFSGIFTVIPYSIVVHYSYPVVGVWFGTLIAYLAVFPLALIAYFAAKHT